MGKKRRRGRLTRARRREFVERAEQERNGAAAQRAYHCAARIMDESRAIRDLRDSNSRDRDHLYDQALVREPSLRDWGPRQRRVRKVFDTVTALRPPLADAPYVRLLGPLAIAPWQRDLRDWTPSGRGSEAALRSLARHLLGPYEVPRFLLDSLMGQGLSRALLKTQVKVASLMATGGSLYRGARGRLLPDTLTRRMCHELVQTPGGFTLAGGVRRAQVLCHGGDHTLVKALSGGFLGEFRRHERFWDEAIHWLCRQDAVDPVQVDPVCDYLQYEVERDRTYSLRGRTWRSVLRGRDRWHLELARQQRAMVVNKDERALSREPVVYPRSGFRNAHWSRPVKKQGRVVGTHEWVMREILDSHSLLDEGREMSHCVASYGARIKGADTSIWSLVCNRKRRLTLEVRRAQEAIVQIRGKGNRRADAAELAIIRDWAAQNGLAVAGW